MALKALYVLIEDWAERVINTNLKKRIERHNSSSDPTGSHHGISKRELKVINTINATTQTAQIENLKKRIERDLYSEICWSFFPMNLKKRIESCSSYIACFIFLISSSNLKKRIESSLKTSWVVLC